MQRCSVLGVIDRLAIEHTPDPLLDTRRVGQIEQRLEPRLVEPLA